MVVFYLAQGIFFPSQSAVIPQTEQSQVVELPENAPVSPVSNEESEKSPVPVLTALDTAIEAPVSEQRIIIENALVIVALTNAGGDIVSYKLKEHNDQDDFVEMVLSAGTGGESHAFTIAFGNSDTQPVTAFFNVRRLSEYSVEFYRDFIVGGSSRFRLTKRYDFKPAEYMFELTVTLDGEQNASFNFSGVAYTLGFGPQIGPKFDKIDQRYEYRRYYTYTNGKQKQEKVTDKGPTIIGNRPSWASIAGKYFTFIAVPYPPQYDVVFSTKPEAGLPSASRLYLVRPSLNGSRTEDMYRFYLGPKTQDALAVYNTGKNSFNLSNLDLIKVADTSGILAPLEIALKWLLMLFYRVIPNYGVAIILLTLLVKALMFPLTRKSSESTLRMQALSPKIKEIQAKYKDNPQKMNLEMAEFYKKEGYNPMSGCLPMIIQIPIFFAMYNLFNNHFDLRGAMFIPGWIPDLSLPEAVYIFPDNFSIPLLGWNAIRLLPFIYVGSQLLYGKMTQTPDQSGNAQMKFMLYAMPIIFFFILYDVPSGLLLYWIMSNVLTLVQQLTINKFLAQKRAVLAVEPAVTIAKLPPKKKKKR